VALVSKHGLARAYIAPGKATVTTSAVEAVNVATDTRARVTTSAVEAAVVSTATNARVTTSVAEVVVVYTSTNARVTTSAVEVLYIPSAYQGYGQAQAILRGTYAFGQCQAAIKATGRGFGQAQADIKATSNGFGQAQANIGARSSVFGQANADIKATNNGFGQSNADIKATSNGFGQANADIKATSNSFGQANGLIARINHGCGQAQADIKAITYVFGQSQANIKQRYNAFGQGQGLVDSTRVYGQAQGQISSDVIFTDAFADAHTYNFTDSTLTIPADFNTYSVELFEPDPVYSGEFPDDGTWYDFYPFDTDGVTGWLRFTLDVPTTITIDTLEFHNFAHDTVLGIYTESSGPGTWHVVASNDDYDFDTTFESLVSVALEPGTYILQLGFYSTATPLTANVNITTVRTSVETYAHGQAQALIVDKRGYGQAQAYINVPWKFGQAQGFIKFIGASGQAQAYIFQDKVFGQAQALISHPFSFGQARAVVIQHRRWHGNAMAYMIGKPKPFAQAQAWITRTQGYGNAQALIFAPKQHGQAQAFIRKSAGYGQAQASIAIVTVTYGFGQGLAWITRTQGYGQAKADIKRTLRGHGLARALIGPTNRRSGQAAAYIIHIPRFKSGQAQATISIQYQTFGLASAIISKSAGYGQARARVRAFGQLVHGQAQGRILASTRYYGLAQAQGIIRGPGFGQAQALITGGRYLVRYNNYDLPGYAQFEDYGSTESLNINPATYAEASFTEYAGLVNKPITVRMKTVGETYLDVKNQVQKAATMLRSGKGFRKLYVQHTNKYYEALAKTLKTEKSVGESMRMLEYEVEFEAKPWLISETVHSASGTGTISTVGRTLSNGGWTPATIVVTGTNVTVSGYTATQNFTGFVSVSGAVTDLTINTEAYTATINGENANTMMYTPNYEVYVGPDETFFEIVGADSFVVTWRDRWYI
jgi:hypothetical protein